jgi:Tfp pilus assembly protein PilZ
VAKERREHSRVNFPQIRVKVPRGRKYRDEFLRDLSAGGLFVSTNKTLDLGSEVQIQVLRAQETDEPLSLTGQVVRVEEGDRGEMGGMAVEFTDVTGEIAEQIRALVHEFGDEGDGDGAVGDSSAEIESVRSELEGLQQALESARKETEEREKDVKKADKQIQALRDRLEKTEKERDELLTAKVGLETELESEQSSKKESAQVEAAQRESQKLRERLAELEQSHEELQAELKQHRADEEVTRNLAERLAKEKQAAERKLEEERKTLANELADLEQELERTRAESQQENAALRERLGRAEEELEDLRQTREQLDGELEGERKMRIEAEARLEVASNNLKTAKEQAERAEELETQLRRQTTAVEEAQERAQWSEERALKALDELEQARLRERDLRRLLAAVSPEEGVAAQVGTTIVGNFGRSREGALAAEIIDVRASDSEELEGADPGEGSPEALAGEEVELELELEPEAIAGVSAPSVAEEDGPGPGPEPAHAAPKESGETGEEVEDSAGHDQDESETKERGLGPADITTENEFRRCLEEGATIELTARFSRLEPVSRSDIQISDWLKESHTFAELKEAASGKMSDGDLLETLHLFFKRSLILLHPVE